jgi:16S rRNA (uracil1498-N3)-methyltransferase
MPRFHCPGPLTEGQTLELPPGAARHVQVLRLQPGAVITLFNGQGGEYEAVVERMGRSDVQARIARHHPIEREAGREIHLAVGMPANERMDWLVEKATELGVASIRPLIAQRSVLKLSGERAEKKRGHWQAVATAACEQCGRNQVPRVHQPQDLARWLEAAPDQALRLVLSLEAGARTLTQAAEGAAPVLVLSGPEGGLSAQEERAAIAHGFQPVSLGSRVLRAETAPLAVVAALTLCR